MTYNVEETEVEERNTISTGNIEIDRRIGGGIPYGTLMLIEGDDASGKSSITQQLFYGALKAGEDVVCYSTETTIQSLIPQMKSIGMDCTDYFINPTFTSACTKPWGSSDSVWDNNGYSL